MHYPFPNLVIQSMNLYRISTVSGTFLSDGPIAMNNTKNVLNYTQLTLNTNNKQIIHLPLKYFFQLWVSATKETNQGNTVA